MTGIHVTQRFDHPAEAIWAVIGDFGGLHRWHPRVRRLDLSWEGRIRTLHLVDGGRLVERLEARNEAACRCVYVLVNGSLPLQACRTTLAVFPEGSACRVDWSCEFEPLGDGGPAAARAMRGLYDEGLAALARVLAPR